MGISTISQAGAFCSPIRRRIKERKQKPALYDFKTNRLHVLAALYAAPEYTGVWRCDTTPRFSPDGRKVVVDSPHGGNGRQMYLIDVSHITKGT